MRYLGIDVHSQTSVWCLLDERGEVCGRGRVETTVAGLESLVTELSASDKLRVGQEVGAMAYLVHDVVGGMHPHPVYIATGAASCVRC